MQVSIRSCAIHGAALWIGAMAGCASVPGRLDAPKAVFGLELAPYASIEECVALEAGERIGFRFEALSPVAFNVHFHDQNAVIMPLSRERTTSESGDFVADRKQIYCLTWEAGAEGSVLDYRINPWLRQQ
jgi:hypothetical protein